MCVWQWARWLFEKHPTSTLRFYSSYFRKLIAPRSSGRMYNSFNLDGFKWSYVWKCNRFLPISLIWLKQIKVSYYVGFVTYYFSWMLPPCVYARPNDSGLSFCLHTMRKMIVVVGLVHPASLLWFSFGSSLLPPTGVCWTASLEVVADVRVRSF